MTDEGMNCSVKNSGKFLQLGVSRILNYREGGIQRKAESNMADILEFQFLIDFYGKGRLERRYNALRITKS